MSVSKVVEDEDMVDSAEVEAVSRILYKVARSECVPRVGSPDNRERTSTKSFNGERRDPLTCQ